MVNEEFINKLNSLSPEDFLTFLKKLSFRDLLRIDGTT